MGMQMDAWPQFVKWVRREDEIEPSFKMIAKDAQERFKRDCSLVVVVLEHKNSAIYGTVSTHVLFILFIITLAYS